MFAAVRHTQNSVFKAVTLQDKRQTNIGMCPRDGQQASGESQHCAGGGTEESF